MALLPCIAKLYESLIKERLDYWVSCEALIPDEQAGFRAGRSCTDAILSIAQPAFDGLNAPKAGSRKGAPGASRSLIVAVDQRAAFDRCWRDGFLAILAKAGCPSHLLRVLRGWSRDRRYRIR